MRNNFARVKTEKQSVYNGAFVFEDEKIGCFSNRAFLYGDAIFETLRVRNRDILFFEEHLSRLVSGMSVLKYDIPEKFTIFKSKLENEIISLLNRNKIFKAARVRITVFRKRGGLYTPQTNEPEYVISASELDEEFFALNNKGFTVSVFDDIKKPINIFSPYKTGNSLIFTLAGIHKNNIGADDCIILNENGQIAESISSNIFIVKDKVLITPPLNSGCINGIIRKFITDTAYSNNIKLAEENISEKDLLQAEEVFLTNSISGIRWVVAYRHKRYFKRLSVFFTEKLNEYILK